MKLAVCFSVYNGLELVDAAVRQYLFRANLIIICYQTTSNKGEFSPASKLFAEHLAKKYNCLPLLFAPDLRLSTKQNELDKHNLMIEFARSKGCSHVIMSATDHFYTDQQFSHALDYSVGYDVTFTPMYTYYKYPTWQLTPLEDYYMPFLIKLHSNTRFQRVSNYPVRVDPSLQVNTFEKIKVFQPHQACMHHYSMVRKDIENKFKNAAASIRWNEQQRKTFLDEYLNYDITKNPGITYFQGRKIIEVPDYFGIGKLW